MTLVVGVIAYDLDEAFDAMADMEILHQTPKLHSSDQAMRIGPHSFPHHFGFTLRQPLFSTGNSIVLGPPSTPHLDLSF